MSKNYKGKNILITGGLGMIGSSIANRLTGLGAKVTILDACLEPYGANEFNIKDIREKVELKKIDIRNQKDLRLAVEGKDIIFNLAGQVSHNDSLKDPFLDADINYIGHLNMLEVVKNINPLIKILYSGSRLQYGKTKTMPVLEDHSLKPLTPYALNKTSAEQMYLFYNRMYGIPVVLFRISNPYGPRGQIKHSKYCMINWFIRQVMEGNKLTVFGDGNQIRDYIYIDDLTEAFIKAGINDNTDGEIFNVGLGKGVTFRKMAETIIEVIGKGKVDFVPWPDNYINVETGDYVADIKKLKVYTDWEPKIFLREGIERTYEYYRKYKKYYC